MLASGTWLDIVVEGSAVRDDQVGATAPRGLQKAIDVACRRFRNHLEHSIDVGSARAGDFEGLLASGHQRMRLNPELFGAKSELNEVLLIAGRLLLGDRLLSFGHLLLHFTAITRLKPELDHQIAGSTFQPGQKLFRKTLRRGQDALSSLLSVGFADSEDSRLLSEHEIEGLLRALEVLTMERAARSRANGVSAL